MQIQWDGERILYGKVREMRGWNKNVNFMYKCELKNKCETLSIHIIWNVIVVFVL